MSETREPYVDWFALALKDRVPPNWHWRTSEAIDGSFLLTGYVYATTFKSGPRKGKRKPDPTTKSTYIVTRDQLRDAQTAWEIETGKCHECYGTGQRSVGYSATEGRKTKPCKRCAGTGGFKAENDVAIGVAP